jgi:hypothetical protein
MTQTRPYVVIAGSGRSGTNRLLDAFELHPETVCRSEPEEMIGGDFEILPGAHRPEDPLGDDFDARWAQAVGRARRRQSARDRIDALHKSYYPNRPLAHPVQKLLARRRVRRDMLGKVFPGLRGMEWDRPMFCTDAAALDASLLVLKVRPPAWLLRTHAGDLDQIVIHQIRDPRAFLNSWYNRWVEQRGGGAERVYRANMTVLPDMLADFGESADRFAEYSEQNLIESQVWLWRHLNEMLHAGLKASPRYRMVNYDAFGRDPRGAIHDLFTLSGRDAPETALNEAERMENTLFHKGHGRKLDPDLCERALARALEGSALPRLLSETA